jgi:Ca2+-binding EF-hand superfamily protein
MAYKVIEDETVYLLSIYDKSEQGDISNKELQELLKQIP